MSYPILESMKTPLPGRFLPPWKWGDIQIREFQCGFHNSVLENLTLANYIEGEFKICQEGFKWVGIPFGYRQPCDLVGEALLPAIDAYKKEGITTDQFSSKYPLLLRFCGRMLPVPGNVVVSTGGVPAVGYNTSEDFRQIGQRPDGRSARPGRELSNEAVRAMNMTIIIALAQRQAKGMKQGCIESREVFEVSKCSRLLSSHKPLTLEIGRDRLCSGSSENDRYLHRRSH